MQVILISLVGGATGFVGMAIGAALIVSRCRRKIPFSSRVPAAVRRDRRLITGIALIASGLVAFLGSFAAAFFGSLPGPSYLEARRQVSEFMQETEPGVSIRGIRLMWPLSQPQGEGYYDVIVKTGSGERQLTLWFDSVTKKTTRIEKKRPNKALQTTSATRSDFERVSDSDRHGLGV